MRTYLRRLLLSLLESLEAIASEYPGWAPGYTPVVVSPDFSEFFRRTLNTPEKRKDYYRSLVEESKKELNYPEPF